MQLLADLTGLEVERSTSSEMSILGTAFLAGLKKGIFLKIFLNETLTYSSSIIGNSNNNH